jgi:excisionase family DNA binding protein
MPKLNLVKKAAAQKAAGAKPALMSRQAVAFRLGGVNERTVDRLIETGKLRAIKIGSRKMIYAASVDALIGEAAS